MTPILLTQNLNLIQGTAPSLSWSILDSSGNPVDISADNLLFVAYSDDGQLQDDLFQHGTGGHITVSGHTVTVNFQLSDTALPIIASYVLRDLTLELAIAQGNYVVSPAPSGSGSGG